MEMIKNKKFLAGLMVVLVIGILYMALDKKSKVEPSSMVESNTSTSTDLTIVSLNPNGTKDYKVEAVPITQDTKKKVPVPSTSRPVNFLESLKLNDEIKNLVTTKITGIQTELKKDSSQLAYWIDLGMYQKMAGDYEGAIISWKYVADVTKNDFIAYGNLGNLYAYYLKDNGMAENYYRLALKRDPKQVYLYTQLAEVYRDVFKDIGKAMAVIDEGLIQLPNNEVLLEFKSFLK